MENYLNTDSVKCVPRALRTQPEPMPHSSIIDFRPVDGEAMPLICRYITIEKGRTCDFSFGGIFMWVDWYSYEYAVVNNTLFIKGVVEDDRSKTAFSLPVGKMPVAQSVELLKRYCREAGIRLRFSAIPEYALPDFRECAPLRIEELTDMGDYLYDAQKLATLAGRKMAKKRNHVNKFETGNPDRIVETLTASNAPEAIEFMNRIEAESDSDAQAAAERDLCRKVLASGYIGPGKPLFGIILRAGGRMVAFTVGDIKGDTLFVHIEKALRDVNGSYEAINKYFVEEALKLSPGLKFVNREDDAGDIGLRLAKQSYHPEEILKKYNIFF